MPFAKTSTGEPLYITCSYELARRLGMVPWGDARGRQLEASRLVIRVKACLPHSGEEIAYLWPWERGLGVTLLEE